MELTNAERQFFRMRKKKLQLLFRTFHQYNLKKKNLIHWNIFYKDIKIITIQY